MSMKNFDKQHEFDTDSDVLLAPEEVEVADKQIVVYNDDFNTFDFVIESLIKVCKHDPIQAEQCTFLIHYKGNTFLFICKLFVVYFAGELHSRPC